MISKKVSSLETQPSEQYSYGQILDYGGKVITLLPAVIGIAYAIGFIIVNIHLLTKYGIYGFELIKTRYILTGFFFLIFTYIIFVISLVIIKKIEIYKNKIIKFFLGIILTIGSACFIGFIIKGITTWIIKSYVELAVLSIFIRIWSLLAITATIAIVIFIRGGGWKKHGINIPIPYSIFTSTLVIVVTYSQLVYPVLPIALGGGNPVPIRLVVESEKAKQVRSFIPFTDDVTTEKVYMIDQSSSSYFLFISSSNGLQGQAIEIRKDYIAGIVHLTEANMTLLNTDVLKNQTKTPDEATPQISPIP